MFPGTALGVLLGNLAYTGMARCLAAKTERDDATAMPLGLDAPTSIGMALLVLGPAFTGFRQQGLEADAAAIATWQLGMAALMVMGGFKLLLPFDLLMVVGGINVSESARAAGDDYRTRDVLLVEALSTLAAGLCGGVAQTTPYIGLPAYKHMGARNGYTLLTGLFVGIGGMLGIIAGLVQWLPLAVLAPIIVYVGLDITTQAFHETPRRHAMAVALALLPAIAYLLNIKLGNPAWIAPAQFAGLFAASDAHGFSDLATITTLGNGFIITAMLWAAVLVAMIEARTRAAAGILLLAAALSLFGFIHSVDPGGGIYLPWDVQELPRAILWQFSGAYAALALLLGLLTLQKE